MKLCLTLLVIALCACVAAARSNSSCENCDNKCGKDLFCSKVCSYTTCLGQHCVCEKCNILCDIPSIKNQLTCLNGCNYKYCPFKEPDGYHKIVCENICKNLDVMLGGKDGQNCEHGCLDGKLNLVHIKSLLDENRIRTRKFWDDRETHFEHLSVEFSDTEKDLKALWQEEKRAVHDTWMKSTQDLNTLLFSQFNTSMSKLSDGDGFKNGLLNLKIYYEDNLLPAVKAILNNEKDNAEKFQRILEIIKSELYTPFNSENFENFVKKHPLLNEYDWAILSSFHNNVIAAFVSGEDVYRTYVSDVTKYTESLPKRIELDSVHHKKIIIVDEEILRTFLAIENEIKKKSYATTFFPNMAVVFAMVLVVVSAFFV